MKITDAAFVISNTDYRKCPPPLIPEYAFIGRSNVGKSSLINMLSQRRNLARISVQPGKTQLINHYHINNSWYLVDLPGYGYAKISKKNRRQWQEMIDGYLLNRLNLICTFVLIDLRVPPQNNDLEVIGGFGENQLPLALIFTKYDKLKENEARANLDTFKNTLLQQWEELPDIFVTSSKTGLGREAVLSFITDNNKVFDPEIIKNRLR